MISKLFETIFVHLKMNLYGDSKFQLMKMITGNRSLKIQYIIKHTCTPYSMSTKFIDYSIVVVEYTHEDQYHNRITES